MYVCIIKRTRKGERSFPRPFAMQKHRKIDPVVRWAVSGLESKRQGRPGRLRKSFVRPKPLLYRGAPR